MIGPKETKLRAEKPVALAELAHDKLVLPSAPHGIRTLVEQVHAPYRT